MSDGSEEKTDAASSRKLKQLRDKGILPSAPVGSDFSGFGAGLIATFAILTWMIERLMASFDQAFSTLKTSDVRPGFGALEHYLLAVNAPLLITLAAVGVGAIAFKLLANKGFVFALERVMPQLNHVNPVNGVKKLFKAEAMVNFLSSFLRLMFILGVAVGLGIYWGPTLLRMDLCAPDCAAPLIWVILQGLLIAVAGVLLVSIVFDVSVQRAFFLVEQRMTKSEVKRERKEMMGQPEIRQKRRQLGHELANSTGAVGRSNAAVYFVHEDAVVAYAFHPIRVPLPKVASRATGAEAAEKLKSELRNLGVPGLQSEKIVKASLSLRPGDPAPREVFMDLAGALRQVMS